MNNFLKISGVLTELILVNIYIVIFILASYWTCYAQDVSTMLLNENSFTKEDLFKSLEGKKIENIEQFIASLPETIRKNYVIIYESKSLQSASFQKPRVIIRSPLSEVMLTFTDPQGSQNKHDSNIEMMYWDSKEKAFKLQEITFNNNSYSLSEVNPQACIKCHGDDPKPNWEPYSTWPGVYGGDAEFRFGGELVKGERKNLDEFVAKAPQHPLYKHLIGLKENFKIEKSFTGGKEAKGLMSYKLTETLTKLNFQKIVRTMQANPNYEKFKYATLYTAACSGWNSPYPDSLKDLNRFVEGTGANKLIELYQFLGTDTSKWSMSFRGIEDKTLRLESPDGDNQNMTYALMKEDKELWPFFNKENPLNWEKNTFWRYGEKEILCEKLKEKSKKVLEGLSLESVCDKDQYKVLIELSKNVGFVMQEVSKGDAVRGKELVLKNCMDCHGNDDLGRNFFQNDQIFKEHLSENPNFIEKVTNRLKSDLNPMPPGNKLPASEQADIIEYLKSFSSK
jgi:hypothetical protein